MDRPSSSATHGQRQGSKGRPCRRSFDRVDTPAAVVAFSFLQVKVVVVQSTSGKARNFFARVESLISFAKSNQQSNTDKHSLK